MGLSTGAAVLATNAQSDCCHRYQFLGASMQAPSARVLPLVHQLDIAFKAVVAAHCELLLKRVKQAC